MEIVDLVGDYFDSENEILPQMQREHGQSDWDSYR